ncbi:DUF4124 domain-containing protein [Arenimonas terrae]|jgi:hypothetical protein|uniref:DUF4124 domain-containing protein n=1 Tax=Arenimonas terrae TaxID=2546226 RepID=A0A5C4RRR6_9GAMM|nr:DUF4124 domain-containing protein [Arenimonas terrae]TNJ33738.1 DUF4124 domain-containing protein [Arenimonas terrae]
MSRALLPLKSVLAIALIAAAWAAAPAAAQVRRCVDAQGVAVYTDRPCEAMQAAPREAPPDPSAGARIAAGFAVRGCARRPETLLNGVRGALEARDVNRLANWYHWTGTGSGAARSLMDELEAIANRPLVSAELIYPETLAPFPPDYGAAAETPEAASPDGTSGDRTRSPAPPRGYRYGSPLPSPSQAQQATPALTSDHAGPDAAAPPGNEPTGPATVTAEPGPDPVSLLVQQMRGPADIEAVSVRFALRQNAGCWWIEL